jgi:ABC-type Fe3+-siderophore transport system permease subunit
MSGTGAAAVSGEDTRKPAQRAERVATVSHILVGLIVASEAVRLLVTEPGLLAWSSLIAGVALVVAGIYELFHASRHPWGAFLVQTAAGIEISIAAAEKFHQHKHYVQWFMVAAGIATIAAAVVKFTLARKREHH